MCNADRVGEEDMGSRLLFWFFLFRSCTHVFMIVDQFENRK